MDEQIIIRGAREHNLKNIDLDIPRNQLVVITGLSGSGKSSLAFDTIYAEGQRRYMESLSAYARQFLGMMERPDVDFIDGLSPVIAIEQKSVSRNPRSTVGTVTEVYDFLRLLFARAAVAYSYDSGGAMRKQSDDEMIDGILALPEGAKVILLAPVVRGRKGHYRELFEQIGKQGFQRVRIDGNLAEIEKGLKVDRYKTHDIEVVVDRIVIKEGIRTRVSQSVETALGMGSGTVIASVVGGSGEKGDHLFSRHLFCPEDGVSYDDPSPNTFSFNSPYGACQDCNGLGSRMEIDPELVIPHPEKSISEGGLSPIGKPRDIWIFSQVRAVAKQFDFDLNTPLDELSDDQIKVLLEGAGEEQFDIVYRYKDREVTYRHRYSGVYGHIWHTYEHTSSAGSRRWAEAYMRNRPCTTCSGGRLRKESLSFRLGTHNIADLVSMDLRTLRLFFDTLELSDRQTIIAKPIVKEIKERLEFMIDVGVGYLSLDRSARSLAGGESQRIRLATQIGTQLTGVLYVLDEPSIGLHPRDNQRLIDSLKRLRDLENSILVVEHDRVMIESADFVVDLGPGAGELGGDVVGASPPDELPLRMNGYTSLTTAYLRGVKQIPVPSSRRRGNGHAIELIGARGHNLKSETFRIPLGTFTCIAGVSGSGKSTLVNQTLYPILANHFHGARMVPLPYQDIAGLEHIDKVIDIDQSPIGRTPRSNPATYTGLFGNIRDIFSQLPEAKIRGYKPGRFSFNVKGGRCESCKGAGIVKLEMNFLPDVYVMCETCQSRRYNVETLEIRFKGKSIADVLEMSVEEALTFFEKIPRIARKLMTLHSVGMGYVRLGQQATTLSGGEAQRVKLAKELSRPGTGRTLYILDEPTTGLHFEDIRHLLAVLQALVDKGNTVLVIEHNLDVLKTADHLIDLGPDGGEAGGHILFAGTPEEIAKSDTYTGQYMAEELARDVPESDDDSENEIELDLDEMTTDDEPEPEEIILEEDDEEEEEGGEVVEEGNT
ncbi:MAG: excinuclease ABC subunit UvrA [Bacteroidetes bacterium]|nr:excinuclease ABC subunit UvrA [Bacteroidota bacterium]